MVRAWDALFDLPDLRTQTNWLEFVEDAVSTHGLKYRQAGLSAKAVSSTSSNWVTQNISDFDQLYADATIAKTELDNVMNNVTTQVGGTPSSRLKDPVRAREKIDLDPDPEANYSWLTDLAAGRVIYDNLDDFYDAVDNVVRNYQVARLNERVVGPLPTGFRDILMNLRMSNGHVVELQISLREMIEASDGPGHALYEEWRTLNGVVQSQQGGVATAAQAAELETLMAQMQNLYNNAYQQILSRQ
jgi:hypothetical protein